MRLAVPLIFASIALAAVLPGETPVDTAAVVPTIQATDATGATSCALAVAANVVGKSLCIVNGVVTVVEETKGTAHNVVDDTLDSVKCIAALVYALVHSTAFCTLFSTVKFIAGLTEDILYKPVCVALGVLGLADEVVQAAAKAIVKAILQCKPGSDPTTYAQAIATAFVGVCAHFNITIAAGDLDAICAKLVLEIVVQIKLYIKL